MRQRRRWIAPYLAESYVVEAIAILFGLVAFALSVVLQNETTSASVTQASIIGLLSTLTTELFIERAIHRGRAGRLERLEQALTDRNIFEYFQLVVDAYGRLTAHKLSSHHPDLYDEIVETLFLANDWRSLAERRLEFRDFRREILIARQLLPTAKERVRAIAVPDDLDYLEANGGADYLVDQANQIRARHITIFRLFVYSTRSAHTLAVTGESLRERIDGVAARHTAAGVVCRILNLDNLQVGPEVPDLNIYDDHTVRFATLAISDSRMQSIVSERHLDVRHYSTMFESLWSLSEPYESPSVASPPGN